MNDQFYDVVDSEGNVIETAEEQRVEAQGNENVEVSYPVIDKVHPPKLSEGELKKLRKQFVTIKLPRVLGIEGCGHRLDLNQQPRHRNCEACWFAWFNNHGEIVKQLDEMFQADKSGALIIQLQGTKFFRRWRQFMATLAQWQKVSEIKEENNEKSN